MRNTIGFPGAGLNKTSQLQILATDQEGNIIFCLGNGTPAAVLGTSAGFTHGCIYNDRSTPLGLYVNRGNQLASDFQSLSD